MMVGDAVFVPDHLAVQFVHQIIYSGRGFDLALQV